MYMQTIDRIVERLLWSANDSIEISSDQWIPMSSNAPKIPEPSSTSTTHGSVGSETENRRFEVEVEHDDKGERRVVLRDMSWGPGVGWYVQKTLRLDAAQVDALLGALCCAKQEAGCAASSCGAASAPDSKIVSLEDVLLATRKS